MGIWGGEPKHPRGREGFENAEGLGEKVSDHVAEPTLPKGF